MSRQQNKKLTTRETQILELLGQGLDTRHIAAILDIAYYTVRKHRSNILIKLQLNTAAQLACVAVQTALFPPSAPTSASASKLINNNTESASRIRGPP
ncbi:response regulator transcription factor [Massilia atriviolacea]